MNLIIRFYTWRKRRRLEQHIKWLRSAKVVLSTPHHSCNRNTTQAVGP